MPERHDGSVGVNNSEEAPHSGSSVERFSVRHVDSEGVEWVCHDNGRTHKAAMSATCNLCVSAVVVRMPRSLHEAVKAKAAREERSMAQAIRYALREYVSA